MSAARVIEEALTLGEEERWLVVRELVESLDGAGVGGEAWAEAWDDEIARRVSALREGRATTHAAGDVLAAARDALAKS